VAEDETLSFIDAGTENKRLGVIIDTQIAESTLFLSIDRFLKEFDTAIRDYRDLEGEVRAPSGSDATPGATLMSITKTRLGPSGD
jgi:hypothetical protein